MADRKSARRENPRSARPARRPSRPFTLTTGWAALILALLTILFFHELVIGGRTFVSPDTSAPAGFVRMGEQSLYQQHVYPLWNPFVFLGMPSFASGTYNPLIYPPDWPLALVNKVVHLPDMIWMILYYFLGGLFVFLLAQELGARPEGGLLAAALFVFAPNLVAVGSGGHGSQLVDSAYLPLMLWLAARWLRRGGLQDLAWLALAGGFQLLRAHVQICFYTWLAIALYAGIVWLGVLATRRGELGAATLRVAGIGAAAIVAFGLAGFYNLPLQDYARWSIRGGSAGGGVGLGYATAWSMAPYELPAVVVPWWVGFGGATYWGGMPFTDYPNAYLGVVAILLAIPAFLANGAARIWAAVLAVFALAIAFGSHSPLYAFLYAHLPLFNKFRVPVMIIVLFHLAVALGVAWGWSAVLPAGDGAHVRARRVGRLLIVLAAVVALVLVAGVMGQGLWRPGYVTMVLDHRSAMSGQGFTPEAAGYVWQKLVSSLGRACLLGLLAIGVAWFARRGRLPALAATAAMLVLLLVEIWPVSAQVMGPFIGNLSDRSLEAGRDDIVDFLSKQGPAGTFRILPDQSEWQSNRYAGFGIASLGGYHAAKPRLYQDLYDSKLFSTLGWLRLLDVAFIVTHREIQSPPPFFREVYRGSAIVYANLAALPRATLVGSYAVVRPAKAILDSVALGSRDMADFTYLGDDPHLALGPVRGGSVRIVSYRLNDVTIDVNTPGPALLRLSDEWYPDWTARVDGRRVPVLRADYLLRAVAVPAGRHTVVYRFESGAMRRGLLVTGLSLIVVLAAFAISWFRRPSAIGPARPSAAGEEAAPWRS